MVCSLKQKIPPGKQVELEDDVSHGPEEEQQQPQPPFLRQPLEHVEQKANHGVISFRVMDEDDRPPIPQDGPENKKRPPRWIETGAG
jgi:hypothetical protein